MLMDSVVETRHQNKTVEKFSGASYALIGFDQVRLYPRIEKRAQRLSPPT
jgi:hypothetical protein